MLFVSFACLGLGALSAGATSLGGSQPSTLAQSDGDWHIGCNEPDHCSYYRDGAKHSALAARTYSDFIPDTETYITDRQGIDTRCSHSSLDLVEKFNESHWIHHFKCISGTSCNNILGSGACKIGEEYTIPTNNRLWVFNCPDISNEKTCRLSKSQTFDAQGLPKSFEQIGSTHCNSNNRTVQNVNGVDIYSCTSDATCVEKGEHAGCMPQSPRIAVRSHYDSHRKPYKGESPSTRCHPNDNIYRQVFNHYTNAWDTFDQCPEQCYDVEGQAVCLPKDLKDLEFPAAQPLDQEKKISPPEQEVKYYGDNEENEDEEPIPQPPKQTHCHRSNKHSIEFFDPESTAEWTHFYNCKGRCRMFQSASFPPGWFPNVQEHPEFAVCEEEPGKFVVPVPPQLLESSPSRHHKHVTPRDIPQDKNMFTFKCDALGQSGVTSYLNGVEIAKGSCPEGVMCEDKTGVATCNIRGRSYLMGQATELQQQIPPKSKAPDFHTFDTRCNPLNKNEVQRYEAGRWVHHWQCVFGNSCRDVDGHGSCSIGNNLYLLPAANVSSVSHGEQPNYLQPITTCNPANSSEIVHYDGGSWKTSSVCIPPYSCFDFDGALDTAFCVSPQTWRRRVWLPWPFLGRSVNNGQVTRCKNERTLEQFEDDSWVLLRMCEGTFKCRNVEGSSNGGCAADDVPHIISEHRANRVTPMRDNSRHFPKRDGSENDLISTGQRLKSQGEILIKEGKDLDAQSEALVDSMWGDFSISEFEKIYPPESSTSSATGVEHHENSAPKSSSSPHPKDHVSRRGSDALVDDSLAMHRQAQSLLQQGGKLVTHGRLLLETIFGNRTDEYIKTLIEHGPKAKVEIKNTTGTPNVAIADSEITNSSRSPDVVTPGSEGKKTKGTPDAAMTGVHRQVNIASLMKGIQRHNWDSDPDSRSESDSE